MSLPYRLDEPTSATDGGNLTLQAAPGHDDERPKLVSDLPIFSGSVAYECNVTYPNYRSQAVLKFNLGGAGNNTVIGQDYYMGWAWSVPERWEPHYFEEDPDGESWGEQIMQLHQSAKDPIPPGMSRGTTTPPVALKVQQKKLCLRYMINHDPHLRQSFHQIHFKPLIQDLTLYQGRDIRFAMHWNYHHETGFLKMLIDDTEVVNVTGGLGFNQTRGPTIHPYQIYLAQWKKRRSYYEDGNPCDNMRYRYDHLTVYGADGSLELVNPPKKQEPPVEPPEPTRPQEFLANVVIEQTNDPVIVDDPNETDREAYLQGQIFRLHDTVYDAGGN